MIESLENAIVEQLRSPEMIQLVRVMAWPDDPKTIPNPVGAGYLLARYRDDTSESLDGQNLTKPMTSLETYSYELRFLVRSLRAHRGAYPVMQLARKLLQGFSPTIDDSAYKPFRSGFSYSGGGLVAGSKKEGLWDFFQLYEIKLLFCAGRRG
jgi:hypothetical protein